MMKRKKKEEEKKRVLVSVVLLFTIVTFLFHLHAGNKKQATNVKNYRAKKLHTCLVVVHKGNSGSCGVGSDCKIT